MSIPAGNVNKPLLRLSTVHPRRVKHGPAAWMQSCPLADLSQPAPSKAAGPSGQSPLEIPPRARHNSRPVSPLRTPVRALHHASRDHAPDLLGIDLPRRTRGRRTRGPCGPLAHPAGRRDRRGRAVDTLGGARHRPGARRAQGAVSARTRRGARGRAGRPRLRGRAGGLQAPRRDRGGRRPAAPAPRAVRHAPRILGR